MLSNYISDKIGKVSNVSNESNVLNVSNVSNVSNENYFYIVINSELFYIFAGLFYFVSFFKKNSNKGRELEKLEKVSSSDKDIDYIYNASITNNTKKVLIFMMILSLLLICERFLLAYTIKNDKIITTRIYYMLSIPLFSKLILKENLYKHQYLSLMISIIGWILLNIPIFLKLKKEDILDNFLNLIIGVIYPLELVLIKYICDKYYITTLKTGLIFGLMSLILTLIGFLIYSLIKYHDLTFFNNVHNFSNVDNKIIIAIFIVLYFIFGTALHLLNLLIILFFSYFPIDI